MPRPRVSMTNVAWVVTAPVYTRRDVRLRRVPMRTERLQTLTATLDRRQHDLTLLAENTYKPHNVAALIRTCDAVGMLEMHTVAERPLARHRLITAGASKWVRQRQHTELGSACSALRQAGFKLLAAHQSSRARDYRDIDYTQAVAIVVGSELWGVTATAAGLADEHLTIPMHGMVSSLNVSVAAALVLYEALRQREAAGFYARRRLDPARYKQTLFEWAYPRIARRCRAAGRPYPELDAAGVVLDNPLRTPAR